MLEKKTLDGNIESLLLAILLKQPNYGYRIVQELNTIAPSLLELGEGTVYPVLHRMEQRGLVGSRWETADSGRPRKYYSISMRGRKQLAAHRQQWLELQSVMSQVFAAASPMLGKSLTQGGHP